MKKLLPALAFIFSLFLFSTSSHAKIQNVQVANFSFTPSTFTICLGDTIRWNWVSGFHNVHITSPVNVTSPNLTTTGDFFQYVATTANTYSFQCDYHSGSMFGSFIVNDSPTASIAIQDNVKCFGGTDGHIMINTAGGSSPYTWLWSSGENVPTINTKPAGTYSVLVTDANGCTGKLSSIITQPQAIAIPVTKVLPKCNGDCNGSLTANPTGGTIPYTYLWNPGNKTTQSISGLCANTYSLNVTDANMCTLDSIIVLNQPAVLTATVSAASNVSCNGGNNGTATVTPSGGTSPFIYSWNSSPVQTTAIATGLIAGTYSVLVTDKSGCTATASVVIAQPAVALTSTLTPTNVSCNGGNNGSINLSASGGTGTYTYYWSINNYTTQNISGLTSNTYSVLVIDANTCTVANTVAVTEPTAITTTIVATNVSCNNANNGSADLTVNGGTGAYTYMWMPGMNSTQNISGLSPNTYTVEIWDANGCITQNIVSITQPAVLTLTLVPKDLKCNGDNNGTISASVSGGNSPYTYLWNNGLSTSSISNLMAGTYSVIVTDMNGCTKTAMGGINQPTALTVTVSSTNTTCNGNCDGTATVNVSGGTPGYTYAWSPIGSFSPTLTGLCQGTYTVCITDANGCSICTPVTIISPPAITITIDNVVPANSCNSPNGEIHTTATGGTGAYTYSWIPAAGNKDDTIGVAAGNYTLTVTDANGCSAMATATVINSTAMNITAVTTSVTCNGGNNGAIDITVAGGSPTFTYAWAPGGMNTEDVSGLPVGCYTVTVTDGNGCTAVYTNCIAQPAALTATATATPTSCFGGNDGTATVSTSGGSGNFSYQWNWGATTQSVSGLTAGNYTVCVTDITCSVTVCKPVVVTQPVAMTATVTHTNVSCTGGNNGTATATASGGSGNYNYNWSTTPVQTTSTATGLTQGTYTVKVIDVVCNATVTLTATITQPALALQVITLAVPENPCGANNGQINSSAFGGTSPYTFSWNPTGQTTALATGLTAGSYTLTITDSKGCTAVSIVSVTCIPPVSVSNIETNDMQINIFPNPNSGEFTLEFISTTSDDYTIEITNMLGEKIYNKGIRNFSGNYSARMDVSKSGKGIYMLTVKNSSGQTMRKIIVQ